ncbi:GNAT family N-acetyltransferase [Dictyobacter arantiisoli]|uniref:N-acetyltransferase domain-containing protein n=1 Tax=Dictyobacter arantiisoli TaxID=2014874 RepID=A0A5A5TES1_9CHLR|nr:GNAT family N-acetyltransferase [Dictyobacter arantiisoli]GCF09509.1 hypothetical protein KDI_30730 [Dictyobacter arantiisoli]
MRIRNFRYSDLPSLVMVQSSSVVVDQTREVDEAAFTRWLLDPELDAPANAFVMTDDDDEMLVWGQAGTLEGIEGEIIGYTVLQYQHDQEGYHFVCRGSVHPAQRRRNAGRALLMGALNRARISATEFEFEAEREQFPIFFEALLPVADDATSRLAAKCGMKMKNRPVIEGLQLYQKELYE